MTRQDVETLERRRDLAVKELTGVRRVHVAAFAGGAIDDRGLAARIERGEVLSFTPDDLLV